MNKDIFHKISESRNARFRIFCFPFAGGNISTFIPWSAALNSEFELVGIQYPGRGSLLLEPALTKMQDIVELVVSQPGVFMDKPSIFFGHSLGARVGYECALKLQEQGINCPIHFFASGSRAPHMAAENKITYNLPEQEFLQHLRALNGTPVEVLNNKEIIEFLLPTIRADFQVSEIYSGDGAKLNCPITVFHGKGDVDITRENLEAWRDVTTVPSVNIYEFNGDHFFINTCFSEMVALITSIVNKNI